MAKATLKKQLGKMGKQAMGYIGVLIKIIVIVVIIIIIIMLALHGYKAILFNQSFDLHNRRRAHDKQLTRSQFLTLIKDPKRSDTYKDELFTVVEDIGILNAHITYAKKELGI